MKTAIATLILALAAGTAHGQGFNIQRHEPTAAGEWSFAVDHPWYTRSKYFGAAGITLDYAHNPLVFGTVSGGTFSKTQAVVGHQLTLHLDLAASFLNRFLVSAGLPIVMLERGDAAQGVSPLGGGAVGDPRVGVMVRLWGEPLAGAFSVNLGFDLWIPVGAEGNHAGDSTVRVLPKVVLGGLTHHILWSFLFGFQYRKDASIGGLAAGSGNTVGSELKLGGAIAWADLERRFSVGPELLASMVATGDFSFKGNTSSLELLVGGHYNIIGQIETGLAVGVGLLSEPGTPDFRLLLRLAYSPMRPEPQAPPPPPPSDRDHDGVLDLEDLCPDEPAGAHPDPAKRGCPERDSDGDGLLDSVDRCPKVPAGPHPDRKRPGCPDRDSDGDGVFDADDQCPTVPAGPYPDPARRGCPAPDRDGDRVPDPVDACPDKPGAPDPDPKKNGCPGLVQIKGGKLEILNPVFFATNRDVILKKSYPVLQAVANAMTAQPDIKRVSVEGHTDSQGKPAKNLDLSQRRAESVRRWLVEHGVAEGRLEAHGYGQDKPVASNKTAVGRAANRRVEFRIVDPAQQP